MSRQISVGELADWIIEHRHESDAFMNDDWGSLCMGIQDDLQRGNIIYTMDEDDNLTGVLSFIPDRSNKILFIRNILVTSHTALVVFVHHYRMHFNGYAITGNRQNQQVAYNTPRLIHLLSK